MTNDKKILFTLIIITIVIGLIGNYIAAGLALPIAMCDCFYNDIRDISIILSPLMFIAINIFFIIKLDKNKKLSLFSFSGLFIGLLLINFILNFSLGFLLYVLKV